MRAETIEIRGEDGCYSLGTGAGAGVQWKEKGNRYGIGGIGNSLEHVLQVSENLEVLDLEVWQQRLAEAEKFDEEGKY